MSDKAISLAGAKLVAEAVSDCADKALIWKAERNQALARVAELTAVLRSVSLPLSDAARLLHPSYRVYAEACRSAAALITTTIGKPIAALAASPAVGEGVESARDFCPSCHGFGYYLVEGDDETKVPCRACQGTGNG